MACMGPELSDRKVDKAYARIMEVLADEFDVKQRELDGPMSARNAGMRDAWNQNLKEALRQVIFQEECENF